MIFDRCARLRQEQLHQNNKIINEGIFLGINADGSLNLQMRNSDKVRYEHGEISIDGIY